MGTAILFCFAPFCLCWGGGVDELSTDCRLLVDHMASRGFWKGVNRTSILSPSGILDNITIEDPTALEGS